MSSKTLFQNSFISRRAGVANFADIRKIAVMLVKETYKDSNKVKIIRKMYQNVTCSRALYALVPRALRALCANITFSALVFPCFT